MNAAPDTREMLAERLAAFSEEGTTVRPVGGGTRSRIGPADFRTDTTISTGGLNRLIAHEPQDLTITIEAGMTVSDLREIAAEHEQFWPQVGLLPDTTVGGVLAGAVSGLSRLRFGPVRDSLLQVVVATGDGRLVTAGGRTVKGVAGYDLPRLMTGSLGSLGVIVEATLKLWPRPPARGWFRSEGPLDERRAAALRILASTHGPGAVVVTDSELYVELIGQPDEVAAPPGFDASEPPIRPVGRGLLRIGVPAANADALSAALGDLDVPFATQFGVGICHAGVDLHEQVGRARMVATELGGHAVIEDGPPALRQDPWGRAPVGLKVMQRLKQSFDPAGILSPGLMPGGI